MTVTRPTLILVFGEQFGAQLEQIAELRTAYPESCIAGCSTAGEVYGIEVIEDSPSLVATLIEFESTSVQSCQTELSTVEDSFAAGGRLASQLPHEGLSYVLVLSEGLSVNGSELVRGMLDVLPSDIIVTGGLSADRARFSETYVLNKENSPSRHIVSCVGFYGSSLTIRCGSYGGWQPFGPLRRITKSTGNIVYEIDGNNALDVYKKYLGEKATELPQTGLNFPFCVYDDTDEVGVVRTILGIDKEAGSLIFAGDVPEGMMARLMHANLNRLVDGAAEAAKQCLPEAGKEPQLALLISCVGRKLVLRQRVEEEIEAVEEILGSNLI
ncbi:MAG: FIST C-terminal domain-containing protein [Kofleriaceae bacterium]|nr:FIST C-terminal domain-containing protein [Kofleriaceae bacterium]